MLIPTELEPLTEFIHDDDDALAVQIKDKKLFEIICLNYINGLKTFFERESLDPTWLIQKYHVLLEH